MDSRACSNQSDQSKELEVKGSPDNCSAVGQSNNINTLQNLSINQCQPSTGQATHKYQKNNPILSNLNNTQAGHKDYSCVRSNSFTAATKAQPGQGYLYTNPNISPQNLNSKDNRISNFRPDELLSANQQQFLIQQQNNNFKRISQGQRMPSLGQNLNQQSAFIGNIWTHGQHHQPQFYQ